MTGCPVPLNRGVGGTASKVPHLPGVGGALELQTLSGSRIPSSRVLLTEVPEGTGRWQQAHKAGDEGRREQLSVLAADRVGEGRTRGLWGPQRER